MRPKTACVVGGPVEPKEPCIRWGVRIPQEKGHFGDTLLGHLPAVDILNLIRKGASAMPMRPLAINTVAACRHINGATVFNKLDHPTADMPRENARSVNGS